MKQIPYYVKNISYLDRCLRDFCRQLQYADAYSSILVSLFAPREREDEMHQAIRRIQKELPDAQVVGSLTSSEIINGHLVSRGIAMTFSVFDDTQVDILAFDGSDMDSREMGESLLSHLNASPDAVAVEILIADSSIDTVPFLHIVSQCSPDIRFFGGLSDDGSLGDRGRIYANGKSYPSGIAAVVFRSASLHVDIYTSFGWQPLGGCMTITKMDDDYTVREIDHKPVIKVYEKYLGIKSDEDFLLESLAFPFYFYRNGKRLARHPRSCSADGAISFGADLKVGEQVRLAYGDPAEIIREAQDLHRQLSEFSPEGLFVTSCVARKMILRNDTQKELNACCPAPSTGLYAYGEIFRHGREIMFSNMALVVAGMREGEGKRGFVHEIPHRLPKFSRQTNIMRHMVHFIQASTAELEQANAKLSRLAHYDRLTNLLNRGEVESAFSQGLSEAKLTHEPFSVLMMDIDDFKGINDNYGHNAGDAALRSIAEILRDSTDEDASPGRWGGDEFFVVLPNSDLDQTARIAERIRRHVADLKILPNRRVTTSIGIASAKPGDTTISLFQRADRALYRAKKSQGKDSVAIMP